MSMNNKKTKWRGIHTTQKKTNELEPITILNRFKQRSMSLPWIDDKKRWAGFPGLAGTSKEIASYIPFCSKYVEPLAGSVKVYQEWVKRDTWAWEEVILNDLSPFVCKWLRREFPEAKVTNVDFVKCIKKYDSKYTFFMFDIPWNKSFYDQDFSMFNRKSVKDYAVELLEICENLTGKFIIASREENDVFRKAKFYHKTITSKYVVSGHYPKQLLTTNFQIK